jgi:putative transport protein
VSSGWLSNPLLLLFAVIAVGYPLGRVKIGGFSLGVAAVLFAGLGAGALDPAFKLPELIYQLGLVLFVYTVGLANGTTFVHSFRRRGLRDAGFVAAVLAAAAALVVALSRAVGLDGPTAAGLFAGSLTNTPALAGVLESLAHASGSSASLAAEPVVAYSVAYPFGVIGTLVGIVAFQRLFRIDYSNEAARVQTETAAAPRLRSRTVEVTRAEGCGVAS